VLTGSRSQPRLGDALRSPRPAQLAVAAPTSAFGVVPEQGAAAPPAVVVA
jgi:hypothetical protein